MEEYRISGVWKDLNNVITHYAFHTKTNNGYTRASKKTKNQAISLLETRENSAKTWCWNYKTCFWTDGENVEVVNGTNGKYLRSDPNNRLTRVHQDIPPPIMICSLQEQSHALVRRDLQSRRNGV